MEAQVEELYKQGYNTSQVRERMKQIIKRKRTGVEFSEVLKSRSIDDGLISSETSSSDESLVTDSSMRFEDGGYGSMEGSMSMQGSIRNS